MSTPDNDPPQKEADNSLSKSLKATSLISAASIINMVVGLIRSKAFAIFLGAGGVGLTGVYFSIMHVCSVLVELGVGMAVVRDLSKNKDAPAYRFAVHRAAIWLSVVLSLACGLILYLFRDRIARDLVDDIGRSDEMLFLAFGAAALLASRIFTGILQGQQRTLYYAIAVGFGSLPGAVAAATLAWAYGVDLIPVIVIMTPLSVALTALYLVWRARETRPPNGASAAPIGIGKPGLDLVRLGTVLTLSVLLHQGAVLFLRAHIIDADGLVAAGLFHAGWTVAMLYMTLITQSLGTDYFPRLTSQIDDPVAASATANQGIQIALLLLFPMVIGTIGAAWLALTLFFSTEFIPAAQLLQFLSLGNIFKSLSLALAYVVMAKGWRFVYFGLDLVMNVIFLVVSLAFFEQIGIAVIGIAYALGYLAHACIALVIARRSIGFRIAPETLSILAVGVALTGITLAAALWDTRAGMVAGALALLASGIYSLRLLARILPAEGRLGRLIARLPLIT